MGNLRQWARVRVDRNLHVRRGAWYPVVGVTSGEAVLEVNDGSVRVPTSDLQIVVNRPLKWSVVPMPRDAVDLPLSWGSRYAVCPNCRARAQLRQRPARLRCPNCQGDFEVAWNEEYLLRT